MMNSTKMSLRICFEVPMGLIPLLIWFLHAVVGATLTAPILLLARRRIVWTAWDIVTLVAPFCLWVALMASPFSAGRKNLTTLAEPFLISLAMPGLAVLRVIAGRRVSKMRSFVSSMATLCAISVIAFFAVPHWTVPSGRGLTHFDPRIIDAHEQRYDFSCIPSSVEMVLKLTGHATPSYYDLQNAWQNKADGSFHDFDGKTFNGLTFHQDFSMAHDSAFPLDRLFDTIHRELSAGRFVIIGLPSGDNNSHNWVIYDEDAHGEFLAVSKFGKWTIHQAHVRKAITQMHGTDIGTYGAQKSKESEIR